jgi:hypothetical protein
MGDRVWVPWCSGVMSPWGTAAIPYHGIRRLFRKWLMGLAVGMPWGATRLRLCLRAYVPAPTRARSHACARSALARVRLLTGRRSRIACSATHTNRAIRAASRDRVASKNMRNRYDHACSYLAEMTVFCDFLRKEEYRLHGNSHTLKVISPQRFKRRRGDRKRFRSQHERKVLS